MLLNLSIKEIKNDLLFFRNLYSSSGISIHINGSFSLLKLKIISAHLSVSTYSITQLDNLKVLAYGGLEK